MIENSKLLGATRDGKWYALPYDWGTEALAWNTGKTTLEYGKASFGDLWKPEYKGLMLCRQRSSMLCTGLWMEGDGKLPAGTMKKAYDDEAAFDLGYGKAAEYVIANKAQIINWWKGTADTQSAFEQDGAIIGETWDGPIFQLKNQGGPYGYMAPVEGALTWIEFDRPDRQGGQSRAGLRVHQLGVPARDRWHRLGQHRLQFRGQGVRAARRRKLQEELRRSLSRRCESTSFGSRGPSGPGSWRNGRLSSTRFRPPKPPSGAPSSGRHAGTG